MNLKQLENKLDSLVEEYRSDVVNIVDNFHRMSQEDREYFLPEALDDMNKAAFCAFFEFQNNIIQYLREVEKK